VEKFNAYTRGAKEPAKNGDERRLTTQDELTDFLLYTAPDGQVKVECILHDETIWMTQNRIVELFGVQRPAITKHLKNIFESGELEEKVVSSILEHTTQHGAIEGKPQTRSVKFYNLDAIISVGYRVNSSKATQFRIWATQLLKEYITKGFVMDDERLKNGRFFGKDYFRELLERVRSIRASERRIYQQITDMFQTFVGISVYSWFRPSSCLSCFSWLKNIHSASSVVKAGGTQ